MQNENVQTTLAGLSGTAAEVPKRRRGKLAAVPPWQPKDPMDAMTYVKTKRRQRVAAQASAPSAAVPPPESTVGPVDAMVRVEGARAKQAMIAPLGPVLAKSLATWVNPLGTIAAIRVNEPAEPVSAIVPYVEPPAPEQTEPERLALLEHLLDDAERAGYDWGLVRHRRGKVIALAHPDGRTLMIRETIADKRSNEDHAAVLAGLRKELGI